MKNREQYFDHLYTESYPLLKKYVFCRVDSSEAEDILQETYFQAYRNVHILMEHPNPTGWLIVTCKNIMRKYFEKNKKILDNNIAGDAEEILKNISTMDHYDSVYMEELKRMISDEAYFLLVKKYVEGYSVEELARELNITDGACKMRLKRARKEAHRQINFILLMLLFFLVRSGGIK